MSTLRTSILKHGSSTVDNLVFDNEGRSTFGNNALYVNAQNGRVGVNTDTPSVNLDVNGSVSATSLSLASQLTVTGNITTNADLTVGGNLNLTGNLTGNLTVNGNLTASGDLDLTGDLTASRVNATQIRFPVVASLPSSSMLLGDVCTLNTDNKPYFYDGTDWRELYLLASPDSPPPPDDDWDNVLIRATYNTDLLDIRNNIQGGDFGVINVGSPSKFGGGSIKVDSYDYCEHGLPNNRDQSWANSAFTIEAWVYFDTLTTGTHVMFSKNNCSFRLNKSGSSQIFELKVGGRASVNLVENPSGFGIQAWHHIAYCRNGTTGVLTLFVDGVSQGTTTEMNNFLDDSNESFFVGDTGFGDGINDLFIDDLRVSDFERYTANFTPPTAELPTSG